MKRTSFFKKILSIVFAVAIVFTVSVREVHYLFSQHEVHEHCENHLHDSSHQESCSVCKFDVTAFTDEVFVAEFPLVTSFTVEQVCFYQSPVTFSQLSSASLRGPPAGV